MYCSIYQRIRKIQKKIKEIDETKRKNKLNIYQRQKIAKRDKFCEDLSILRTLQSITTLPHELEQIVASFCNLEPPKKYTDYSSSSTMQYQMRFKKKMVVTAWYPESGLDTTKICKRCHNQFDSRNALFRHLRNNEC